MIKLEGDDRPTYVLSYSRKVSLIRNGLVVFLVGVALLRWGLAWLNYLRPVLAAVSGSARGTPELGSLLLDALAAQPVRPLIAAHISLLLVAGAVAFIYVFLPNLSLTSGGLAVRTALGWQAIPWNSITTVRITSFEEPERHLVLVQGHWSRWSPWPRLVSACLGAGFEPGLLLTSSIRDFEPLVGQMVREVRQVTPEAVFDEEFFSLPVRLLLEPTSTLEHLVEQARDEGWPLSLSAQAMAAVAGGLVLSQLLILVLMGGAWWKPLALAGLCGLEWGIGALYLYALTEVFPAHYQFREGALLYPLPQIPRALLSVPMAMLVAAGVPFLGTLFGLAGVLWAVLLTAFLVQQMYRIESILPALLGGTLQALFQFIVLSIVFTG
jgi:hypothetical protein